MEKRGMDGRGREGRGRERKEGAGKRRDQPPPPSEIPGSAPACPKSSSHRLPIYLLHQGLRYLSGINNLTFSDKKLISR